MDTGQPGLFGGSIRRVKRGVSAFADPAYLLLLVLGFTAWILPDPGLNIPWDALLVLAVAEELIFRGLLQGMLIRLLPQKQPLFGLTPANISTSLVFSLVHFLNHPPLWAMSVFVPSLIFGWSRDRFQSLLPCCFLHFTYNLLFFYRP